MEKSPDAFRTISEVADWLGVQAHVLRFWESKFTHVKPVKRAGGRRYYRPADMLLLGGIKKLLHDDGMTIKGVQKTLREQGVAHVSQLSQDLGDVAADAAKDGRAKPAVVPFKRGKPKKSDTKQPVQIDHEPTPVEIDTAPETEPTAETFAEHATESEPEKKPEPVESTPAPPPAEDQPILPSFLHRPSSKPAITPAQAEKTLSTSKPSLVVDAPDPPTESDLPYSPGPLAHLAKLERLSAAQIAGIEPLARELQSWLTRAGGSGAA